MKSFAASLATLGLLGAAHAAPLTLSVDLSGPGKPVSPDLVTANDRVRKFSFSMGLFGQGAKSVDDIGISFPGGKILGDPKNVKLRFDTTYVQQAADGKL